MSEEKNIEESFMPQAASDKHTRFSKEDYFVKNY